MRLKILTYNIHKGFCFYSREYILDQLREAIRSTGADIVFLQEVMGVHPKDKSSEWMSSQFEFLADQIWSHYAYGKNAVYSNGHHGNAILSKYPILEFKNIDISTNRFEKRGLLHVKIKAFGTIVNLICVHLDLFEKGRLSQLERIVSYMNNFNNELVVLAGDFNDWSKKLSAPLLECGFEEVACSLGGRHALTFPSWFPLLSLDRVYVRGFIARDFQILSRGVWRKMSDHAAVLTELAFKSASL